MAKTAAAAPPSMNHLHPVEVQTPVGICGVAVYPGDVIVADEMALLSCRVIWPTKWRAIHLSRNGSRSSSPFVGQGRPIPGTYPANDETKALYQAWIKAGEPPNG